MVRKKIIVLFIMKINVHELELASLLSYVCIVLPLSLFLCRFWATSSLFNTFIS